jgi:hypothetical protein
MYGSFMRCSGYPSDDMILACAPLDTHRFFAFPSQVASQGTRVDNVHYVDIDTQDLLGMLHGICWVSLGHPRVPELTMSTMWILTRRICWACCMGFVGYHSGIPGYRS